jgi:transcriptional regulator with XRE-family HTH domain
MSNFANQLKASLEADNLTQSVLTADNDLSQGAISRYVSGENRPNPEKLDRLLTKFSIRQRMLLTLAYLDDHVPPSMRDLVNIEPHNRQGLAKPLTLDCSRMPADVRAAYEALGSAALADRDVGKHLISIERLLQSRRLAHSPANRKRSRPRRSP